MKRIWVVLLVMMVAMQVQAESWVWAGKDEVVRCAPRELPSVGVRLDNGRAVLGLHGASVETKAACGWYRVVVSGERLGTNQVVVGRSYVIQDGAAQEVLVLGERRVVSLQERAEALFNSAELQGLAEDKALGAVVEAVAIAVTNKLQRVVTNKLQRVVTPGREQVISNK